MAHPVVKVLAHPFGRRIGIRPALDLDMDGVIASAVEHGVALETNGHRDRLDLPADWIASAAAQGALFAANSDAHRVPEVDNIGNAVATLQHAGIRAERVVNTFPLDNFLDWIERGRLQNQVS
jgi:histidinol phosphatase-like PHP family hydrolase